MYIWEKDNWTKFTWDNDALIDILASARYCQGALLSKVQMLGFEPDLDIYSQVLVEEVINTSEIEGEQFNRDSVRSSAAKKLGLPFAGKVKQDRRVDNLIDVLVDAAKSYANPLTFDKINSWHASMFAAGYSGIHKIIVGDLRGDTPMQVVSGYLDREVVHYEAPPRNILEKEYCKFIEWFNNNSHALDGLLRAAIAHLWFVILHPYDDGNGRLARAITDLSLAQDEKLPVRYYSLSYEIMKNRNSYYDILERTTKGGSDVTEWVKWFLEIYVNAIDSSEQIISKVFDKQKFWNVHLNVELTEKQKKVINKLLDAGKGGFEGGLTRRKYVSITKASTATATRDIADLLEKGLLIKLPGEGRSSAYDINWI